MKKLFVTLAAVVVALSTFGQNTFKVGLTWTPNTEPDITKYRVYRGDFPGVYSWSQDVGMETTVSVGGLQPGRTYYFAVTAFADFLESNKSNEVAYNTPAGAPATVPTGIKVIRTLTDITVTWDAAPEDQFVQRWLVAHAIKNKGPQPGLNVTEPKAVLTTQSTTDVYEIFITADGILGKSPAAFVEVPGIPPAPIGLEIVPGSLKVVYPSPAISQ